MAISAGTRLGPYEIVSALGAGGMGEVYRARDTRLQRDVAVKILASGLAGDPRFRDRFEREARVVASLNHPHICTLYDIGNHQGMDYLVMEYLDGETLAARLRHERVPLAQVVEWALQVAAALELAHSRGVVHRDLKPGNLFVTAGGAVKVLDFGLAKTAELALDTIPPTMAATDAGTAVGTVAYMSPEQARGEAVDARSDVFSFGLVLYEMLTGQPAFAGATTAVIFDSILNRDVPSVSRTMPAVPQQLDRLLCRMLAKSRDGRPQTLGEVCHALREVQRESSSGARGTRAGTGTVRASQSIAVLPFADLSAERDQLYFCEGMADEIITALSGLEGLRVASRTSAVRAQEKGLDTAEIGRKLNAQVVLEGSVRKAGNRLRIVAQLTKVEDGYQLWAGRYDRDLDDVFAIQDEIAHAIAAQLKVKLLDDVERPLVRQGTTNLEAYNLYLKGRYFWERRNTVHLRMAVQQFEHAVAADPEYALAYAGLCDAYVVMAIYGARPGTEMHPKAVAAAERAHRLDPDLAEVHHSLGAMRQWLEYDWVGAEREYDRALAINPRLAITHAYRGLLMSTLARHAEAYAGAYRAMELEPDSALMAYVAGAIHYWGRDAQTAIRWSERALALEPNATFAHWMLSSARWLSGDVAGALEAAERGLGQGGRDALVLTAVAANYARLGRTAEARAILAELLARGEREYVLPLCAAEIYTALGEVDHALDCLERAYAERVGFVTRIAAGPEWDALRAEPRFRALLRRINLPDHSPR